MTSAGAEFELIERIRALIRRGKRYDAHIGEQAVPLANRRLAVEPRQRGAGWSPAVRRA